MSWGAGAYLYLTLEKATFKTSLVCDTPHCQLSSKLTGALPNRVTRDLLCMGRPSQVEVRIIKTPQRSERFYEPEISTIGKLIFP